MEQTVNVICPFCGSDNQFPINVWKQNCQFCGRAASRVGNDRKDVKDALELALQYRKAVKFDEAEKHYHLALDSLKTHDNFNADEVIRAKDNTLRSTAHWGLVLCKYHVVYEQEENGAWWPTCYQMNGNAVQKDQDFVLALEYASKDQAQQYEKDAEYIDEIQKEIARQMKSAQTYDIFLCYKESADINQKTLDSKLVRAIYNSLNDNYNVFFAPETLKEKAGANYEASIFTALEKAKVMLVVGTQQEYFNAVWVHSEWKRFLNQRERNKEKKLIPVFSRKEILPEELSKLQGLLISDDLLALAAKKNMDGLTDAVRKTLVCDLDKTLQNELEQRCPKCKSVLTRYDGRIGFCPEHKWVSPAWHGFDREAEAQNQKDKAQEEKIRKEKERQDAELQRRKAEEKKRRQNIVKGVAIAIVMLLLVGGVGAYMLVLRPAMSYSQASTKFSLGDYQAAREEYGALGNYRDALARGALCDAMIDLQEGRTEDTVKKLDQLTADGMEEITAQLADALRPVISGWRSKGVTPRALLLLLTKADVIDPAGTLNIAVLKVEGHIALLDNGVLSSYTADVNEDGEPELIALNADYSVTVYRMTDDGNMRITVDNKTLSACETHFGRQYQETDENAAVACFSEAYRLLPNADTRAALVAAYRVRAAVYESSGNMDSAIADAKSALDVSGEAEDFSFFYELNLYSCANRQDAQAIEAWNLFFENSNALLARFDAQNRWRGDAAQLHVTYAMKLAREKDFQCVRELRTAVELGADLTEALAQAKEAFSPGMTLVCLYMLEMEGKAKDSEALAVLRAEMAQTLITAVSDWKTLDIAPADVLFLIRLADAQQITLEGIDREAAYQAAALKAAGSYTQSFFGDWDRDGYEELLTFDEEGVLRLYGIRETWDVLSSVETHLPCGSFTAAGKEDTLILVLSKGEDELLSLSLEKNQLRTLFREKGITQYQAEDGAITFSRLLEGSIARYNHFTYTAHSAADRPIRTGIDWPQDSYPYPETAAEAVQRYFEAMVYDIPEEAAMLTAESGQFPFFRLDNGLLPVLSTPLGIEVTPYCILKDGTLLQVDYQADGQSGRLWAAAENRGGWKISGFSTAYGKDVKPEEPDKTAALLALNEPKADAFADKGERQIYQLLVPASGKLSFVWHAAVKNTDGAAYHIQLLQGSLHGVSMLNVDLKASTVTQMSNPMLIQPGVYYLIVEALAKNTPEYSVRMEYEPLESIEMEPNDSQLTATPLELNASCYGNLFTNKDVDYYSFVLTEVNQVNVQLNASGSGKASSIPIQYSVLNAAYDEMLSTVLLPGNMSQAETGSLYLSPGTYLIRLEKGTTYSGEVYCVAVQASVEEHTEAEMNNTPLTANEIPVNQGITGSFGAKGDVDCFAFTLPQDALVQPRFSFLPTDASSKTYVLTLMDGSLTELNKIPIGGKESAKVILPMALAAGRYFMKIENPVFVQQPYTLRIATEAVEASEKEPNNTTALATPLIPGRIYTGIMYTEEDVDYFRISFAEQTTATLKFSFPEGTGKDTVFLVSIEQNGKNVVTPFKPKANSGGFEKPLIYPAGEYYIKIKPSSWMNVLYTIEME